MENSPTGPTGSLRVFGIFAFPLTAVVVPTDRLGDRAPGYQASSCFWPLSSAQAEVSGKSHARRAGTGNFLSQLRESANTTTSTHSERNRIHLYTILSCRIRIARIFSAHFQQEKNSNIVLSTRKFAPSATTSSTNNGTSEHQNFVLNLCF